MMAPFGSEQGGERSLLGEGAHRRSEAGVSLIELLITIAVFAIVSGMAATIMINVMPSVHADSSMELVVSTLQQAHQAAISQRRNFLVTFIGTNEIKVQREELPPGSGTLTTISDNLLGNGVTYTLVTGVPDTPDGFGSSKAITFTSNVIVFMSDGTAVDTSSNLLNGTVFMAIGSNPATSRAVTVMGATSRVKGYRYNGSAWN
ncbi:MAG TPA: prepilin-type N-terminal cleavage/methylation domain-containing protein [Terriglobia bacterium]|nr:prepilin-type N-terminal cleavage/methylation domain-containing protein [Terriglobia bacterium]